ncbi:unnamed protein product [Ceutorhynchus assimilis]|uniref:Uncharacterized protein n=1 Tax=Ceutorhynchus assimilis TaxID=467358 RepID=A0A9P0DJ40_9CUCU|nr:unnamed protein product [Ceutorhynchus assimilis]
MSIMWIMIYIIGQFSEGALCLYQCTMNSFEVTCTGLRDTHLLQPILTILNKTDVTSVNITNGNIKIITQEMLKEFINLQSLYITYCRIEYFDQEAFVYNPDLQELSLNNNALRGFNLKPQESLKRLDLSYNKLKDISGFKISDFPRLNVLNLENNLLTHLPDSLLEKLKEENSFYLLATNNNWNCSRPEWSEILNPRLINAFCSIDNQFEAFEENSVVKENTTKNETYEKPNCLKCSFVSCIWWSLGGIWFGVILGNVPKIHSLLFKPPKMYENASVQCGRCMHQNTPL